MSCMYVCDKQLWTYMKCWIDLRYSTENNSDVESTEMKRKTNILKEKAQSLTGQGDDVIKLLFMVNSIEHKIYYSHQNTSRCCILIFIIRINTTYEGLKALKKSNYFLAFSFLCAVEI